MNIFTTIYKGEYKATLRSLQFSLLQKLAGANADKFECFRPVIGGLPTQQSEQERKAEFVELFNQMLLAGVNFDSLPTGCGCEDLVGNICNIAGSGYAELIQGIDDSYIASQPQFYNGGGNGVYTENPDGTSKITYQIGYIDDTPVQLLSVFLSGQAFGVGMNPIHMTSYEIGFIQGAVQITAYLNAHIDSGSTQINWSGVILP